MIAQLFLGKEGALVQSIFELAMKHDDFPAGPFFILLALSEQSEMVQVKELLKKILTERKQEIAKCSNKGLLTLMRFFLTETTGKRTANEKPPKPLKKQKQK
jgi:hypothetical protein